MLHIRFQKHQALSIFLFCFVVLSGPLFCSQTMNMRSEYNLFHFHNKKKDWSRQRRWGEMNEWFEKKDESNFTMVFAFGWKWSTSFRFFFGRALVLFWIDNVFGFCFHNFTMPNCHSRTLPSFRSLSLYHYLFLSWWCVLSLFPSLILFRIFWTAVLSFFPRKRWVVCSISQTGNVTWDCRF